MRYGFGLLALLVVVAIILILQANVTIPTVQKGMEAREQASQIAGVDETGGRVMDTYDLKEVMDGGRLRGMRVTRIKAGSAMQQYYGLRKDDVITEYGAAHHGSHADAHADAAHSDAEEAEIVNIPRGTPVAASADASEQPKAEH